MRFKSFLSSVQHEFASKRQMLTEYVRKDSLLGKFFDVFLFEEEPACDVEACNLYLPEVEKFYTIIWRKTTEVGCDETRLAPSMGGVAGGVENATNSMAAQSSGMVVTQSWPSRVFDAISAVGEVSTSDLVVSLSLDNSSGSLKRTLRILLSDGIIEYTITEKPRSRLQKYRLTEKGRQMLAQEDK